MGRKVGGLEGYKRVGKCRDVKRGWNNVKSSRV
jgi:hypothetical protein